MTNEKYSVQVEGARGSFGKLFIFDGHLGLAIGDGVMYLDRATFQSLSAAVQNGLRQVESIVPVEMPLPVDVPLVLEACSCGEVECGDGFYHPPECDCPHCGPRRVPVALSEDTGECGVSL